MAKPQADANSGNGWALIGAVLIGAGIGWAWPPGALMWFGGLAILVGVGAAGGSIPPPAAG